MVTIMLALIMLVLGVVWVYAYVVGGDISFLVIANIWIVGSIIMSTLSMIRSQS